MKARPRSVERNVAKALSEIFARYGLSPVERIPVLGREGPDISLNELGWVIDVKSRLTVPRTLFSISKAMDDGEWLYIPLKLLFQPFEPILIQRSIQVERWYRHMQEHAGNDIPVLVLHRPKIHILNSKLVIDRRHYERTYCSIERNTDCAVGECNPEDNP